MIGMRSKIGEAMLVKVSRMKEVIKPTRPHKHDGYYEIILLFQGAGFHTINDEVYEVTPPVFHMLKPGQVHCWDFSQIPKGYVIMFRENLFQTFRGVREKLYELPAEIKLAQPQAYMDLFEQCYLEYQQVPQCLATLEAYLNLIIIKLDALSREQLLPNSPAHQTLYAFKKLVDQSFLDYKSVHQYADLLKLSTAKLNEVCKSSLGKSAQSIIKERIVLEAKNLLYHTDKTVAETAFDLQFSDASNFVKFFKAQTGFTPQQYRKMR